ncbi:hypothetical protein FOCC_FOCC017145 [Frankliniella occidentalis]|nr:hypothetical protein FOCC_FOCC017145 [Frankliniella occidentalis]
MRFGRWLGVQPTNKPTSFGSSRSDRLQLMLSRKKENPLLHSKRICSKIRSSSGSGLALVYASTASTAAEVRTGGGSTPEVKDTREGEDVSLSCRFAPQVAQQNPTYFWLRINTRKHDNVAIGNAPLDTNYRLDFRPDQGRYDLLISNVSYERDNGQFECRVKAPGSGLDLHSQVVALTVLTPPEPPTVQPNSRPVATEGKPLQLTCSSAGGSPDPIISVPCEYPALTLPSLLFADFPRVEIGPENPVRVERDGTATLQCNVDAKPRVSNVRWTRNGRFVATSFTHTIHRVSVQDAGKYVCSADNGLGQAGEAELTLDVLYPPQVSIDSKHREAEEFESVTVHCNVSANPKPSVVEWVRDGRPEFRQSGPVLSLPRVTAESAGTYTCRAVNMLDVSTPPRRRVEHIGNASLTLLVRHKPGLARISPDKPVATEGSGVTLSCTANPPGWPAPQYRWWRDPLDQQPGSGSPVTVLGTGPKYTIQSAHLGSEGTYHCQASNEIGQGEAASVLLEVHQPPRFLAKLQPHVTRKVNDEDFTASCGAHGKPKPSIRWLKDGREIGPGTAASGFYDISTEESESRNSVFTVQSVLKFSGPDRKQGNQLEPSDRGMYTCVFENEVKRAETTMHLRIEHEPIILNRYNKVAYDLREDAQVVCRVQAYPRPEFQWSYGSNAAALLSSSDGHYDISTTSENGDVYTSVLKVSNIRDVDYGEYTCRANNGLGTKRETIKLQPKGPPEHPQAVKATAVGHNFVTLLWEAGFDGGVQNTKYFVSYRRVAGGNGNPTDGDELASDCYSAAPPSVNADLLVTAPEGTGEAGGWQEFDCQKNNPCNVTSLQQHASYVFKVKAYNTKGHSNYSEPVPALTKVDRIPAPQRATYDTDSHSLSVYVAATCLTLDAQVEASLGIVQEVGTGREMEEWHHVESFHIQASGAAATRKEVIIPSLAGSKQHPEGGYRSSGRSLGDESYFGSELPEDEVDPDHQQITQTEPRVRVRFCLRANADTCGDYTEAEIGPSLIREAHILPTPTLIAIVVSCVVFILFVGLLFMFCRCKRHQNKKAGGKNYEMNSSK